MSNTSRALAASLAFWSLSVYADCLPAGADLQSIPGYVGSYTTTISDQDRRNSSGQPITGMKAILQQDRANVHRFNHADPRDQKDSFFTTPDNRQLLQSAGYRGRCGKDYVELINALDQPGRDVMIDVHTVRSNTGLTLYVELTGAKAAVQAVNPSFDCAKAGTPVEHSICDNPVLAQLDVQLSDVYRKARAQTADRDGLRNAQRAWVKSRNQCGADVDCLRDSYATRISALGAVPDLANNSQSVSSSGTTGTAAASASMPQNTVQSAQPVKSFNQILMERIGPDGWARCASSQVALSAINARDGSLGKSAADANRQLGRVLGDVRQLMLSQGYSGQSLDRLFSAAAASIRTGDQAFNNVANCLDSVTSAIDEFEALKNASGVHQSSSTTVIASSAEPSQSQGQTTAIGTDPLAPLEFLFDPRKRWVGANETTKSGESCAALLDRNGATMITHQYTPTNTFARIRVGGQHPRRHDPNIQKHGSMDIVTLAQYGVVSEGRSVVSFIAVTKASNAPAIYTTPWELDKEQGILTRTDYSKCDGCDATMKAFIESRPKTEVKYWCAN